MTQPHPAEAVERIKLYVNNFDDQNGLRLISSLARPGQDIHLTRADLAALLSYVEVADPLRSHLTRA